MTGACDASVDGNADGNVDALQAKVGFVQCDNKAKAQYMQSDAGDGSHAICDGETSDFHVTGQCVPLAPLPRRACMRAP